MNSFDPQALQLCFERFCVLQQQLATAQTLWQESETILQQLKRYYHSAQWLEDFERQDLKLHYSGEAHSILSEDALYNAIHEHHAQAKQWIRLGLNAIDAKD